MDKHGNAQLKLEGDINISEQRIRWQNKNIGEKTKALLPAPMKW